ncbi:hypothetical protein GF324_06230 [bacterium]|nr:hypothetical protein [bacterium]
MKGTVGLLLSGLALLLYGPALPVHADGIVPDSLIALLEGESLDAASFLYERLTLWYEPDGDAGGATNAVRPDTTVQSGRLLLQTTAQGTPGTRRPATFTRFYLANPRYEAGGMIHRSRGETAVTDLWRAYAVVKQPSLKITAGDIGVNAGHGWTVATRPAMPYGWRIPGDRLQSEGRLYGRLSREEGRGWKGAGVAWRKRRFALDAWAGIGACDARTTEDGTLLYASQGDHTGPARDRIYEALYGMVVSYRGTHLSVDVPAWWNRWSDRPATEGQPSRFDGMTVQNRAVGTALSWQRDEMTVESEVALHERGRWGGELDGSVRGEDWRASVGAFSADKHFPSLHARPFLPFGSDPAGRAGLTGEFETGTTGKTVGLLWAQDWTNATQNTDEPGQRRRSGRVYLRYEPSRDRSVEVRIETRSEMNGGEEEWRSGVTVIGRVQVDPRSSLQVRTQAVTATGRATGYAFAGKWMEQIGRRWQYSLVTGYAMVPNGHPGVTLPAPYTPGTFPVRRATTTGLKLALKVSWKPIQGLRAWGMLQTDSYDELTLVEDPSLQERSMLLHLGLSLRSDFPAVVSK